MRRLVDVTSIENSSTGGCSPHAARKSSEPIIRSGRDLDFTEYGTDTTFRKQELFNPPKNIGDDLRSEMLHVRLDVSNTADLLILTTRTIRPDPSQN